MTADDRDRVGERPARAATEGTPDTDLPAGLEAAGRDEELVRGPDAHASGSRADHRHSVPGTGIAGAPAPAADEGEDERARRGAEGDEPTPPTERRASEEQSGADSEEAESVENPAPPGDDAPTG